MMDNEPKITSHDKKRAAMEETTRHAFEVTDHESEARRKKTERLKALRLSASQ
ncbi:hypothetical protein [Neorhizobium alkalisoli]|uniref:Uncharacterized protein n=1 Tax=Neorhizobium alkalisoli TaxID=528178 RepID=A0A561PVV5_9HYPH|nr:hypothetical protein [Neorhizobium alkalisoli]TWF42240.1 hypothetical protein FHW37_12318 [Neorhizobium alkalisoli]